MSGLFSGHDTAIILCQAKPRENTTKTSKSEVNLESIESISKLSCDLYPSESKDKEHCNTEFIISPIKSGFSHCNVNDDMPTWVAIKPVISDSNIPIMQVGFLPFISKPVTEHATVYTAIINFVKVLDQKSMPSLCDECVYRIMVDIYIKCHEKFKVLVPCLGGFHTGKCLKYCIGKYIKGTGLEDVLIECKRIGKKTNEQVLNGTHHAKSLRSIIILSEAIEKLKWDGFSKFYGKKYSSITWLKLVSATFIKF